MKKLLNEEYDKSKTFSRSGVDSKFCDVSVVDLFQFFDSLCMNLNLDMYNEIQEFKVKAFLEGFEIYYKDKKVFEFQTS